MRCGDDYPYGAGARLPAWQRWSVILGFYVVLPLAVWFLTGAFT